MKPPEVRKLLLDMAQAGRLLRDFCEGRTLEEYEADAMLRSAVERQFEIIGEALRQVITRDPSIAEEIADTARIIAFRNRLIHGYASVSNEVVWGVIESNLPRLRDDVARLLGEESGPGAGGDSL